jgi:predicted SAM-dependent methyltransferase
MLTHLKQFVITRLLDPCASMLPRTAKEYLTTHAFRETASLPLDRATLGKLYLRGEGLEIGGLDNPLKVPAGVRVRYVDFQTSADLRKFNPGAAAGEPDIVDDAATLRSVADSSQDFVIACHLIEHMEDPIGAVKNWLRVLKRGGIIFLGLPDKRFTFDAPRPVTPFAHLMEDHRDGGASSRVAHHAEVHRLVLGITDERQILLNIEQMGHTHCHVWTQVEMLELLAGLRKEAALDFELEAFVRNGFEMLVVLRKGACAMDEGELPVILAHERELYRQRYPDYDF